MESKKDSINVSIRIRPVLSQDNTNSSSLQIISTEPPVLLAVERSQTYHFDNIFSEEADQEKVFDDAVRPFVDFVKKGYNCTVFAYGQTGTGKTYTMGSGSQKPYEQYSTGIIPRALEQLFDKEKFKSEEEIEVFVSFCEIYNEKVFDLLQPGRDAPLPVSGFVVQGLSTKSVSDVAEANRILEIGNKSRHVGETKQNVNSSRSHAIFTVYFTLKNSKEKITGKLNLVDLAGSESVRKTQSKGSTFQEGVNINKGLLSIGQVISALSTKSSYIPYRQSMITSILQGSLNIENYVSLIACVSANPDDTTETLQTLDFAQRAKRVRSNPEINQIVAKYKKENPSSFGTIRTPMKRPNTTPLRTPAAKKMALPPLPLINESSNTDSSRSQFSINSSSASSRISPCLDITQQALSPVIRKYMTRMEASMMERLETVIKTTFRRSTRASLRADKCQGDSEKENTPKVRWSQFQTEVSKIVRSEIAQMTVARATSSPIEDEKLTARRLLKYDSPDDALELAKELSDSTPKDKSQADFSFKVPDLPPAKKKQNIHPETSISPIENEMTKPTPRRSLRLSSKGPNNPVENNNSLSVSGASCETTLKDVSDDSDFEEVSPNTTKTTCRRLRSVRKKIVSRYCTSSASTRNKRKSVGFNIAKTPSKILVERALKKHKNKDSPYTAHAKKVLNLLNHGAQRDIEKLPTIGPKTAEGIFMFRKLKGSFNDLEDLKKVPGWGLKKFERFFTLNYLRKD